MGRITVDQLVKDEYGSLAIVMNPANERFEKLLDDFKIEKDEDRGRFYDLLSSAESYCFEQGFYRGLAVAKGGLLDES